MKKGFTLVEIIAVVTVLGILAVVGTVAISNILKSNRERSYDLQIKNIEQGARNWANRNVLILPDNEGDVVTLTLLYLKQEGFVEGDIKDPITEEPFPNDMLITITRKGNSYVYDVLDNTGNKGTGYYNPNAPVIALVGSADVNLKVNTSSTDDYTDPGVIAKTKGGADITEIEVVITKDGNVVDNIPLNKVGHYVISYTVSDNNLKSSISRNVKIEP